MYLFLWLNPLNKQTDLEEQHNSNIFYIFFNTKYKKYKYIVLL